MSYYGVSVLLSILVTSLVAFYLLYKAKELNLGIVISISIGSIILGFTFYPAFRTVLKLLSDNININKKIASIITLITILFVFLLFVLIVSFIISISIPKKIASIDCCVVIDSIISRIKIDDNVSIKNKLTGTFGKTVSSMKEIVKNAYSTINKLKKPVDTKQIIDTMGIVKNENSPMDVDIINQTLETNVSAYENLAVPAYEEVVTTKMQETVTDEVDKNVLNNLLEIMVEDQVAVIKEFESEIVEADVIEDQLLQSEIVEAELMQILSNDQNETVELVMIDNAIDNIEYSEGTAEAESINDANSIVLKAFESKNAGRKEAAIEYYIEALQYEPKNEMIFWIVLDICALYKQLGLSELAKNILEGLVSEYGAAIQPDVKMEILNYLE